MIDKLKILLLSGAWSTLACANPYINRVWEYRPAPGQFVNLMPEYEAGDTEEDMRQKADEALANHAQSAITLGSWGGYVTVGFDHTIVNVPGQYDFAVWGNAAYANQNPKDTSAIGGSSEPGIVMVSRDANHNGIPDDEWYELAGSEHSNPLTRKNYTVTYSRAEAGKDVAWISSQGESGVVPANTYHRQAYFPQWVAGESLSFTGTRLRDNGKDESGTGSYYVQYCFDWGYADNHPNQNKTKNPALDHKSEFKIDWAVDTNGNPVQLKGVDFIRIYTGVLQVNGWLGECSTEIMDCFDLHPSATGIAATSDASPLRVWKSVDNRGVTIHRGNDSYNLSGQRLR